MLGRDLAAKLAGKLVFYQLMGTARNVYSACFAVLFHAGCDVYRVAPDVIGKLFNTYDPCNDRTGVNADS